jgi:hypothetical protein
MNKYKNVAVNHIQTQRGNTNYKLLIVLDIHTYNYRDYCNLIF